MVTIDKVIGEFLDREAAVADFIQNGPSEGIGGYVRDGYRHRCNELANVPPWARALGGLPTGSASRICKPYWDDQGVDGPTFEPPFEGGQCDGQIYIGTWEYESGPENSPTTTTVGFKAYGPIGGAQEGENSSGQPGAGLVTRGGLNTQNGSFACGGLFPVTIGPLQYRQFVNAGRNPRIISISPCGLDNCGDPPPGTRTGAQSSPRPRPVARPRANRRPGRWPLSRVPHPAL